MTVCDLCKGTGKLLKPWYDTTGAMTGMTGDICFMCDGKGTIGEQMTNEEYIKSLNTEGLAELLYEYRYDNATPQQRLWLYENEGYCKKCIAKWLKELHTGGES